MLNEVMKPKPPTITHVSTPDQVILYEKWERFNRLCIRLIRNKISAGIGASLEQYEAIGLLLKAIDQISVTSHKDFTNALIARMTNIASLTKAMEVVRNP